MRVAVLGGGLQGACVAMELASAGIAVDIYDKNDQCLTQASAQNEGKIHLGYVYGNDRTLKTARTLIRGALAFTGLLRRWLGSAVDTIPVSAPFYYLVHDASLLSVAEVANHLERCHAIALADDGGEAPEYFGSDYRTPPARLSQGEAAALFEPRLVKAAWRTAEIGIDPKVLARLVRTRLSVDPRIRCLQGAQVHGVEPNGKRVTVDFEQATSRCREPYDHVVNTLWEGRLAIDKTAGLEPARPWLFRVRHNLRLCAPAVASGIPSATIVLGPFGDVVSYGNGSLFLSWYPAGLRGASSDLSPPPWPRVLEEQARDEMRQAIQSSLARIVPAIAALTPDAVESWEVTAGIIFAWGATDIDDPASGLHARHAIGPQSRGRYHTVDTGKLTMAPLFGKMVADHIRRTN